MLNFGTLLDSRFRFIKSIPIGMTVYNRIFWTQKPTTSYKYIKVRWFFSWIYIEHNLEMATVEFNRKYFFGLRRCDGLLLRYDIWERQTQGHAERKISITLSPTERASPTEANCSRSPARWRPATVLRLSRNSSILFTMLNVLLIILPLHLSLLLTKNSNTKTYF